MIGPVADKFKALVGLSIVALFLAACEEPNTYVEPPPPKVTISQPLVQEVTDYLEFTGTAAASAQVEVPARVPGVLREMLFQPGTRVAEGDLLFVIDPVVYEADLQVAKAELASAEARRLKSSKALKRAQTLIKRGNVSQAKLDEVEADSRAARAEVQIRQAKLKQAQINLDYTQVKAPISGRVGRNRVDPGNLVGDGEATILTEVTDYDPMYVYFTINERDLLRVLEKFRRRVKEKDIDPRKEPAAKAEMALFIGLANESGYPHEGVLDFAESGVDTETGTLRLRGAFANSEIPPRLFPGLFVRVRLPIAERSDIPLVSERAIGIDQSGTYLLVVTGENQVQKRAVVLGQLIENMRVIEDGLKNDEWVIVNGIQRARPGGKVDPEMVDMASLKLSGTQSAAELPKKTDPAEAKEAPVSDTDKQ